MTTPFPSDHEHAAWDREYVERFWEALDWTDRVLEEFSGWFNGKTSPVHLFWHSLDLAVTRFSGRDAPPVDADPVTQEAYSSEVISFGFWAGDDNLGDAAYYSYTAPEPDGLRDAAARRRGVEGHGQRLARDPALRGGAHRRGPADDAARVPAERLRGGRAHRRLGHLELRVDLVPHAGPARRAARDRRRRVWPARIAQYGRLTDHAEPDCGCVPFRVPRPPSEWFVAVRGLVSTVADGRDSESTVARSATAVLAFECDTWDGMLRSRVVQALETALGPDWQQIARPVDA